MIPDVVTAQHKDGYRIELTFENGRRGIVDFSKYLSRGGVYERLRDPEFFRSFKVNEELGVLTWGDEVDIAPETLYSEATGEPLPDWMTVDEPSANKAVRRPR
jgi:hypothetical protein